MSTLNDYRNELQNHGFTDLPPTILDEFINDAYFDVCSREPWPFLEKSATVNTVGGTATLTMPTDFGKVISMTINAQTMTLTPIRLDDYAKRYVGRYTDSGTPFSYYFEGTVVKVHPVPDTVYAITLKYLAAPTAMTVSIDTPLLPTRHHRVIALGALVNAYRLEDDPELAAVFEAQYEKRIQTMREDLWKRQYDRPDLIYDTADDSLWDY